METRIIITPLDTYKFEKNAEAKVTGISSEYALICHALKSLTKEPSRKWAHAQKLSGISWLTMEWRLVNHYCNHNIRMTMMT